MDSKQFTGIILGLISMLVVSIAQASVHIPISIVKANGNQKSIGYVKAEDSICGVLLTPNLHNLPPGIHGFHIHEHPSCADNGNAAGGHLDPANSDEHRGPYKHQGHLGDLPVLIVDTDGNATLPTLAPRFKLKQLKGHSLMIHAGADNYSDTPEKNGGGGERYACGVIP